MYSSPVDIWNLALSALAVSARIQDVNEKSKEAAAFRDCWEGLRDQVLRDFDWPFARSYETLTLVASQPNAEWQYSYRFPPDALAVRRMVNPAGRNLTPPIPFDLGRDAAGRLIFTDLENAVAVVTLSVTAVAEFPVDMANALALLLAGTAGPRVMGGDLAGLANRALQLYAQAIASARANAFNEAQLDPLPDSEFIQTRL